MEDNRKDIRIVESIAASHPSLFRIWSPNLTAASSAYVAAFTAGVPSFFAGVGLAQWLVKVGKIIPADVMVAASMAVGFGTAVGVFVLVYFFDLYMHTNRYKADYPDEYEEEPEQGSFIATGADHAQLRFADSDMKRMLRIFAQRYPSIKTLGINRWENGRPFTRAEYHQLMAYLETIRAVERAGRGRALTAFGESKLADWAAGIFDNSPHPESGASDTRRSTP